jgi:hypothetical protein
LTEKKAGSSGRGLTRIALIITNFLLIEPPVAQIFADKKTNKTSQRFWSSFYLVCRKTAPRAQSRRNHRAPLFDAEHAMLM